MYNYYNKKKLLFSVLLILILAIGIGYAYLTSNLSISGNTSVSTNTWNIHFENIQVKDGSVTATTSPTLSNNNTSITYTINLNRPKEYYEFTVDVKNDGTLPGKVSISSLSGITSDAEPIIDYTITYKNGRSVNIGDILNAGAKKTIKVRVFYKDEIDPSDFPANDLNLTLTYTLQYVQSEEDEVTTEVIIQELINNESSCFTKYEGQVTDQPGETVTATNVYFNKCGKRYVIFGGFCWQMIRTTETGGMKMIYYGEPKNGQCLTTRGSHKGIIVPTSTYGLYETMDSEYLYGDSFTYDLTNNTFTLNNTISGTWSYTTYTNLLGKFTCKNMTGTCTVLYSVNGYYTNTNPYVTYYTIGYTNYAQIGTSAFNGSHHTPAHVGYMLNEKYRHMNRYSVTNTNKFGSSFTYDTNSGMYTLSGTTQDISDWSSNYNQVNNTHYTCWNTTGVCSSISYVYYTSSSNAEYINISDGKDIGDALVEMLTAEDVNVYNSSIKGVIESWYAQNLIDKTHLIEDTVYCNSRNIIQLGAFNPDGGSTSGVSNRYMYFRNYQNVTDLTCLNETDQFAVSNNKAKLKYPIALLQQEEAAKLSYDYLTTNSDWFEMSAYGFLSSSAWTNRIQSNGVSTGAEESASARGIRPVLALSSDAKINSGIGIIDDPWVVE